MVTVITTKEELTTPVNHGVTGTDFADSDRSYNYIKDYQEVDFHRSASCKPLPEDLYGTVTNPEPKSSIKGRFLVQIDAIELRSQMNNNQNEQGNSPSPLLLTLTDGITSIRAIANDPIADLTLDTKSGSKLLLTDTILIKHGVLQLTNENTRFKFGSNTYPRPKSAYRGRSTGSYRPPYEGRRNNRYDNDDGETNFGKRPPPKTTLMDFMTSLKLSDDHEKGKERPVTTKRRSNNDQNYQTTKTSTSITHTNSSNHQSNYSFNNNHNNYAPGAYGDQITFEQEGVADLPDGEDDPSHANHRERRNPLPPRLQRVQEERSRRNPGRYYDESHMMSVHDLNGLYQHDPTNHHAHHAMTMNPYLQHPDLLATVNGSVVPHLAYYPANPNTLAYGLAGIPNQTLQMASPYPNDGLAYCYGPPYPIPTFIPASIAGDVNGGLNVEGSLAPVNGAETNAGESQNDENNDSGNKSDSSSSEQKPTPTLSSHDSSTHSQPMVTNEQDEAKQRTSISSPRPRWKVGDPCLARWNEDGEFYYASVVQIQPPHCTVLFCEYNNYEQVHFSDLKIIPRDQPYYQYVPPSIVPPSDFNALAVGPHFLSRASYYPATSDGCLAMPEAPPFPFNSAGTFYMYQTPYTPPAHLTRSTSNALQGQTRRHENSNSTKNSFSPSDKHANGTNPIEATVMSADGQVQDASVGSTSHEPPSALVISDNSRERSTSTESLPSNKGDEQNSTNAPGKNEEEEPTRE